MINEFIEYYKNNEANLLHSILLSVKDSRVSRKGSMGCRRELILENNLGFIVIVFMDKKLYSLHIQFSVCNIVTNFNTQEIKINKKIRETAEELYQKHWGAK